MTRQVPFAPTLWVDGLASFSARFQTKSDFSPPLLPSSPPLAMNIMRKFTKEKEAMLSNYYQGGPSHFLPFTHLARLKLFQCLIHASRSRHDILLFQHQGLSGGAGDSRFL